MVWLYMHYYCQLLLLLSVSLIRYETRAYFMYRIHSTQIRNNYFTTERVVHVRFKYIWKIYQKFMVASLLGTYAVLSTFIWRWSHCFSIIILWKDVNQYAAHEHYTVIRNSPTSKVWQRFGCPSISVNVRQVYDVPKSLSSGVWSSNEDDESVQFRQLACLYLFTHHYHSRTHAPANLYLCSGVTRWADSNAFKDISFKDTIQFDPLVHLNTFHLSDSVM